MVTLSDSMSLVRIIKKIQPDEIYNLGAQSHVAVSFETPEYTADTVGLGASQNTGSNQSFRSGKENSILSSFNF